MKKKISVLLVVMIVMSMFAGCGGNTTIDGTWEMYKKTGPDGTVFKGKSFEEFGVHETYVVSGDTATYILDDIRNPKEVTFDLTVEKLSETEYVFKMSDTIEFAKPVIKGNTFSYKVVIGNNSSTYYFKKQK